MSPHEIAAQMLGCKISEIPPAVSNDLEAVNGFIIRCPLPDDFPHLTGLRSRQVVADILVRHGNIPSHMKAEA